MGQGFTLRAATSRDIPGVRALAVATGLLSVDEADVSGVTMCDYDLRLTAGAWRIETEACNVSGG